MSMPILYLKTTSGEDVIGELVNQTETSFLITKPILVKQVFTPMRSGLVIGMLPWAPITELLNMKYTMHKMNIVAAVELPDNAKLVDSYKLTLQSLNSEKESLTEIIDEPTIPNVEDFRRTIEEEDDDYDDEEFDLPPEQPKGRVIH